MSEEMRNLDQEIIEDASSDSINENDAASLSFDDLDELTQGAPSEESNEEAEAEENELSSKAESNGEESEASEETLEEEIKKLIAKYGDQETEIMQMKPDLLSNERWIDLLDLGDSEKANSLVTVSVRAAESENEDILAGRPVADPEEFEDHILHWKVHTRAMQERTFKEECPPELREEMLQHIAIHEFLMIERAKMNPGFEAKLAELPNFPVFPNGYVPRSLEQQRLIVQGQANQGLPVTGMIPGEDKSELEKGEENE